MNILRPTRVPRRNRAARPVLRLAAWAVCLAAFAAYCQPVDWLWARSAGGTGEYERAVTVATGHAGHCYVAGYFTSSQATISGHTNSVLLTNTVNDRNVFLAKYTPAGELVWAQSVPGFPIPVILNSRTYATALALDRDDNIYVTGAFRSYALFGTTNTVALSAPENVETLFLAKYASDGALLWAQAGQGYVTASGIALQVDDAGQIYLSGFFGGGLWLGDLTIGLGDAPVTVPAYDYWNIFLARFDPEGRVLWARSGGGPETLAKGLALDHAGGVYCSGTFRGSFAIDTPTNTLSLTNPDGYAVNYFLLKFDNTGAFRRLDPYGGVLTVAPDNSLYIASSYLDTVTLGTPPNAVTLTSAGSYDVSLAKYTSDGDLLWAKTAGGPADDFVEAMGLDPDGNVLLTGIFGYLALGTNRVPATFGEGAAAMHLWSLGINRWGYSAGDLFVAAYDANGPLNWAVRAGGTDTDDAWGVASDGTGGCYVAGFFVGAATFGEGAGATTLTNDPGVAPNLDGFIARLGIPPRFTDLVRHTGGVVDMSITGSPGIDVQLTASTNLQDWDLISTMTLTNGPNPAKDTNAPGLPHRFYRLLSP